MTCLSSNPSQHVGLSALLLALAACGGGGNDGATGGSPAPASPSASAPDPAAAAALTRKLSLRAAADLGGLAPTDVNNKNEVLGTVTPDSGRSQAAIWSSGKTSPVGTPLCADASAAAMNCLHGGVRLNDDGQVLLSWSTLSDHGFQLVKAGQALGGYASSEATDLAADGTVLAALGPGQISTLLVARNGQLDTLAHIPDGGPPEHTIYLPKALNDTGRAVGYTVVGRLIDGGYEYSGADAGYVYDTSTQLTRLLTGTAEKPASVAAAVNNAGTVVGKVFVRGKDTTDPTPMRWDATLAPVALTCPNTLGEALAVNHHGVIAGACGGDLAAQRAALWFDGQQVDVNALLDTSSQSAGWVVRRVTGLNENGWMIAEATQGAGEAQPVLLMPEH
jgi:uncharacterized membrane protein